jgi:hypothetical protein
MNLTSMNMNMNIIMIIKINILMANKILTTINMDKIASTIMVLNKNTSQAMNYLQ